MILSSRLEIVVSALDLSGKVADIGTGHAQVPIYLAKNTAVSLVVASEYKDNPYQKAKSEIEKAEVGDKVQLRRGFGLEVLSEGEVEEIVIAGLGASTIQKILGQKIKLAHSFKKIVLQPMNKLPGLRRWLLDNNFRLIDERIVKEKGTFYQVLEVKKGKMKVGDEFLLEVGPYLIERNEELVDDFLNHLENRWQKIVEELAQKKANSLRCQQLEEKINSLKEVKRWRQS